jgi:hypothetical protein
MKMEQCCETSAHKIQTPENHPKERQQQILLGPPNQGARKERQRRYKEMHEYFLSEKMLERYQPRGRSGEDGRILKWILKTWRQNVNLIQVTQHRGHRWAVLNAVMNFTLRGIL